MLRRGEDGVPPPEMRLAVADDRHVEQRQDQPCGRHTQPTKQTQTVKTNETAIQMDMKTAAHLIDSPMFKAIVFTP